MSNNTVVYRVSSTLSAIRNCIKSGNTEWQEIHRQNLDKLIKNWLPSGSGFDESTCFDHIRSTPEKLIFDTSFHHMNEVGLYNGWTYHKITVTPSFTGVNIKISGRNKNGIKDYIHDVFLDALTQEVKE